MVWLPLRTIDHVQRPVESFRRQIHIVQPGRPGGRVGVVRQHFGRQRQHPVADDEHVDLADPLHVARRHQFLGLWPAGV